MIWTLNIGNSIKDMGDINFCCWCPQEVCVYSSWADVNYIYCQCLFVKLADTRQYQLLFSLPGLLSCVRLQWKVRHNSSIGEEDLDITERKFILCLLFIEKFWVRMFLSCDWNKYFLFLPEGRVQGFSIIEWKHEQMKRKKYFSAKYFLAVHDSGWCNVL